MIGERSGITVHKELEMFQRPPNEKEVYAVSDLTSRWWRKVGRVPGFIN
jgi:hypothetical protein